MTPDSLAAELALGRIRSAYLVAGSEPLLRDEAIAALRGSVLGDAPAEFNFDRFEGDVASPGALHDALRMLPVFAPRRLVWLREPTGGRGGWKAICEALPGLLKAQAAIDSSVLVVSATSIDRRTAWVRAFGDALIECEAPRTARELAAFVKGEAASRGLELRGGVAETLVERVGASLLGLRNELLKVALLAGDGVPIEKQHVFDSAADLAEEPVWDLTDAIGEGRIGDALGVLAKVRAAGAPAPVVLGTLAGHFRKLVRVRNGAPVAAAPFVQRKLESQARRHSPARLLVCLRMIHETDEALKGQGALSPDLALERLVLGLST